MSEPGDPPVTTTARTLAHEELPFGADTGPLIALARVEKLDLLPRLLGAGVIPPAVHREARIESGRPGAKRIGAALSAGIRTKLGAK